MVAISFILSSTGTDTLFKYAITLFVADKIPSLINLVFDLSKCAYASFSIACASMVAVVVPSPASLTVLRAASLSNVAPMFSTGFKRIIESATVTPSFVIIGLPFASSNITHLPLAPNVELTAFVSFSIPLNTCSLAVPPKFRFFTII